MTQVERNRLAMSAMVAAKGLGIMGIISAYLGTYTLGIVSFVLAGISLIICVALCLVNLRIQAKEEWTA